jgi:hypothetical protein
MFKWLRQTDQVLRGEATRLATLRGERLPISGFGLSVMIFLLALVYGACMGSFAAVRPVNASYWQLLATTVKMPALFFLTLAVTFPSLYVFNALVGSRLDIVAVFRLLVAAMATNLAVLASLGPIVAFFSLSTTSYPFMLLLNVLVCGVSGVIGLIFLLQTLNRLTVAAQRSAAPEIPPGEPAAAAPSSPGGETDNAAVAPPALEPGPLDRLPGHVFGRQVKLVFNVWVIIFGLVGAQMGWVLRPFLGAPGAEFQWFRERQSNFFQSVYDTLLSLFSR